MAVTPINVARVSQNLRALNLLNSVRSAQVGLFRVQNQLASGLRFNAPSEDAVGATQAGRFDRRQELLAGIGANLRTAAAALNEADAASQEANNLLIEANATALQVVEDTLSADERQALLPAVDSMLEQLVAIANRRHLDTHLFSGHAGSKPPFELTADGVMYHGDAGRLVTFVDTDLSQSAFTISGQDFFNAVSEQVEGVVDLDPLLTRETRVSDLRGADGKGVRLGRIEVTFGSTQTEVDLSGAATVGDVLDKLNAELPSGLTASITLQGINVTTASAPFSIVDVAGGNAATDLGILAQSPTNFVFGLDLDPRVTPRTRLADLQRGSGISVTDGIVIRNGNRSANVDFSGAQTVEDVLNRMNATNTGVRAEIAADGRTLLLRNLTSGADLTVEENGGTTATALGIRSMHEGTKLAKLNDGAGVSTVDGDDFRITTASGAQIDIDLDALNLPTATLEDVIGLINAQSGGLVTAGFRSQGNGLEIRDNTAGPGALRIERLNVSPAIDGLGLDVPSSGGVISGRDVHPIRVNSPFTALLELRRGMQADDTQAVQKGGQRLADTLKRMQRMQGEIAAMAQQTERRSERLDAEDTAVRIMLSNVRDVDFTDAVVQFQQLQTALQANLTTSSRVYGLSLIDFLQ